MIEIFSPAKTVVTETLQAVPGYFLERYQSGGRVLAPTARDHFLAKESEGECTRASAYSVYRLAQHPGLFKYLAIIRAVKNPDDARTHLKNPAFVSHTYFIARDQERQPVWYAASPANFRPGEINPFTSVLESSDLSNIIGSIQRRDGGSWSSSEEITRLLEEEYEPPILLDPDHLGVTEIQAGDKRSRYTRVVLSECYPR